MRSIVARAIARADDAGAAIDVIALAGRAGHKRGADRQWRRRRLDAVVGIPAKGEVIDGEVFDGLGEAAVFPGDLPSDPRAALRGDAYHRQGAEDFRFVRFRPPIASTDADGLPLPMPHIRLDRALQFLLGDRLA